ncbi:hypothetical protein GFS24_00395 [Chitinophaga sp. SYP-B3965]|uniref:hypothetical protein n=1 Tax=Chitinophaga sp. SYP-B3965 TaxID=2663120 RepID=UPI001299EAB6|nr:hypothetical protein [Chitinophaga sp. SYP-B3965]MRG43548.1 hypothetical protein [Chitinophaga sp. SYP-B3965]
MKKISYLLLVVLFASSCEKNNDSIKEELEKALPVIQVTSMGLMLQTGPFVPADVIGVTFGGAITKANPGTVDFAWYDAPSSGAATRIDSVHFPSFTEKAATANGNNSVTTSFYPATYPNTNYFTGTLALKLTKLPVGNKSYTLRIYVRTEDGSKVSTFAVTKFITMK